MIQRPFLSKLEYEIFPLTFREFLVFKGLNKPRQADFAAKESAKNQIAWQKYIKLYDEFMEFGGFPAVVLEPDQARKKHQPPGIGTQLKPGNSL